MTATHGGLNGSSYRTTWTGHDGVVQPGALLPNQIRITQHQYNAYVLAHLRELWPVFCVCL